MDLFQNLPYDIALQCLIRVPYSQFHGFESVCKAWKDKIKMSELIRLRKSTGIAQSLVVLSQAYAETRRQCSDNLVYRLVVLEPKTGCWSEMPALPGFANGLPLFCEMVVVGSFLVVIGGYAPGTWECLDLVFIFDFLSSTWRRGNNMPGGPRAFFGCASDGDRTVFIAGGHDLKKNALKSTWAYDVAMDKWTSLPDTAKERDECDCLFHGDKFHVIGGYPTNMQGCFHQSVEMFDMSTRQWSEIDDMFIDFPNIRVKSTDEKLYMCHAKDVVVLEDDKWKFFAKLPVDVANNPYLISIFGHLLVVGTSKSGEPHHAYKMDLNEFVWTKVEVPIKYSGHVQSAACLII